MMHMHDAANPWPFARRDPFAVVLHPRAGTTPSNKPPVRIFLGTEDAQYRAERVFFYSVERFRDPSRVYEIYLMKNIEGFDRRNWRTGFTNYRYAIPDFAGGEGRAIYNDVDQIYLADPALLFDLEMGAHGYLAISRKDTSVMLMDCATMRSWWSRERAASMGKHALIDAPAKEPGLWGQLDGHWNARDQEYRESLTKCLHYTALHQQPWQPFPSDYSYHPNPLAYIWHELEEAADAEGYQLFTDKSPSPEFARMPLVAHRLDDSSLFEPLAPLLQARLLSDVAVVTGLSAHAEIEAKTGMTCQRLELDSAASWQPDIADAVIADDILTRLPPADLAWVLDRLFAAARKWVYLRQDRTTVDGFASAAWFERRLREAAAAHSGKAWRLDVLDSGAALPRTVRVLAVEPHEMLAVPRVISPRVGASPRGAEVEALAGALGCEVESVSAHGSWPAADIVICSDAASARAAKNRRRGDGGDPLLVLAGHVGTGLDQVDLVASLPAERLPIRDNVLHLSAAPARGLPVPVVDGKVLVMLCRPREGYASSRDELELLGGLERQPTAIWLEQGVDAEIRGLLAELWPDAHLLGEGTSPDDALAIAAEVIVTCDQAEIIATAVRAGRPVTLLRRPRWFDRLPMGRKLANLGLLLTGGGTSYRGTPHQQHFIARAIDGLVVRSGWRLAPDPERTLRALVGRGLARWHGEEAVCDPKPLDDLQRFAHRVQQLLARREHREVQRRD